MVRCWTVNLARSCFLAVGARGRISEVGVLASVILGGCPCKAGSATTGKQTSVALHMARASLPKETRADYTPAGRPRTSVVVTLRVTRVPHAEREDYTGVR